MAKTAPAAPAAPARDEDLRVALVEIAKIQLDPKDTDRILEDKAALGELAGSIALRGVLQPVGLGAVKGGGGVYRYVWGRRRILAAKAAGLREIPARVRTYASEAELLEDRETENLQRQDLNPIEEAAAVARLLDLERQRAEDAGEVGVGPELPDAEVTAAMVARVAARLGKSETWVRDRAFLAKLSGKSRELVLAGRLPLTHAREIAKLADPNLRDQLAARAAVDMSAREHWQRREHPMELRRLREEVARSLYSLAQVPWALDVPFAEAPACAACPHNSANAPGLFEHHSQFAKKGKFGSRAGEAPAAGVCTNPSCFGRKSKAASAATRAAARRFLKVHPEAKGAKTITAKQVEVVTPAHVDRSAVAAVARDLATRAKESPAAAKGAKVKSKAQAPAAKDGPHTRAVAAWTKANQGLEDALFDAVRAAIARNPEAAVWSLAAQVTQPNLVYPTHYCWSEAEARRRVEEIRKSEKQAQGSTAAAMVAMLTAGPTADALEIFRGAAAGKGRLRTFELYLDGPSLPEPVAGRVLEALGVGAAYRSIEGFLAAELEKSEKASAAKPAGKKKASGRKKAAAKVVHGVCRVCGCTEYDCSRWVEPDLCSRCEGDLQDLDETDDVEAAAGKSPRKKAAKKKAGKKAARKGARR